MLYYIRRKFRGRKEKIKMNLINDTQVSKMSLLQIPERKRSLIRSFVIRCIDIVGAIVGLIMMVPLWLYVAIEHIKNKDEGPVFYHQKRIGKNGKIFKMYKFGSESIISNFPQFINLLKGEMTLVGPRPYMYYEKEKMGRYYDIITQFKPGLTGVYQISGKSSITFNERLDMDLRYIFNNNLKMNLKIMAITLLVTPKYRSREYFNEYVAEQNDFVDNLLNNVSEKITLFLKRVIDIMASIVGLLILAILVPIVWIGNRICKDKGPVFYSHERIGKNGKHFKMYKFRSMIVGADDVLKEYLKNNEEIRKEFEETRKLQNDPRITKFGSFLRKTSLDEFPQFINVLKGEMSLIGPRAVVDDEIEKFGDKQEVVLSVKPGVTGYWAANGRSNTSYEERIEMETYYVENMSIVLDIKIIFKTIYSVIKREGAV